MRQQKVVIIGGGIVGASAAYALSKQGMSVTLIDRGDIGQATDAAAGIICPWLSRRRNKAWYRLVKQSAAAYPELVKSLEADGEANTGYKQVGAISIHHDVDRLQEKRDIAIKRKETAPEMGEIRLLNEEETKEIFPLVAEGFQSLYISGAARVDGRKLREALTQAAIKYGTKIIHGEASLVTKNGQITGALVNDSLIEADNVIVAAGAWVNELLEPLQININIRSQKAQILHLENDSIDTAGLPVVMPPNNQYMLSFDNNRFVVGATHEEKVGFNTSITAGGIQYILNEAIKYAPELANWNIKEARAGFRPISADSSPIIGTVPGFDNLYLINGLGATGLTAGPYLGQQIAKLLLGESLDIDLKDYEVEKALKN